MRKAKKIIVVSILSIIGYFLFFGMFIFKIPIIKKSNIKYDVNEMKAESEDLIYSKIIDNNEEALDLRLKVIDEAKEYINVSYLTIFGDRTGRIFSGSLINKANQGIKINIVVDSFSSKESPGHKALSNHPNINVYFFDEFKVYNPTTINNVMHDKLLVIDNNYGFVGGRNMGNKFLVSNHEGMAYDRDILVYNQQDSINVVKEINEYHHELSNSKYVTLKTYKEDMQEEQEKLLKEFNSYYEKLNDLEHYLEDSIEVLNATFVRSPLNRLNKEPVLFNVINDLSIDEKDIVIQTPYITESRLMKKHFKFDVDKNYTFITNNINTNPNLPASTNYINIRNRLVKNKNLKVYESQLANSIHAKSLTIGDDISIIGSQNVDSRSMFLSTESMIVVYSKEFNDSLNKSFKEILDSSLLVNEKGNYEEGLVEPVKFNYFKHFYLRLMSLFSMFVKEML